MKDRLDSVAAAARRKLSLPYRLKLRGKLFLSFMALVLLPILVLGLFSYLQAAKIIEEQVGTAAGDALNQLAINIGYRLSEIQSISDILCAHTVINGVLRRAAAGETDIGTAIDDYHGVLDALLSVQSNAMVYRVRLYIPGQVLAARERDNCFSFDEIAGTEVYTRASEIPLYWQETHSYVYLFEQPMDVISLNRIIYSQNSVSKVVGFLAIDVRSRVIQEILEDSLSFERGCLFVYGGNGLVTGVSFAGDPFDENGDILTAVRRLPSTAEGLVQKIQGEPHLIWQYGIPGLSMPWRIALVLRRDEIAGKSGIIRTVATVLMALCFFACFAIAAILSSSMVRGISRLERHFEGMRQGSYRQIQDIRGWDEIAELQRQFNVMVTTIERLIEQDYRNTILLQAAEFKALEGQINPHFLYNTLDSARWLAKKHGDSILAGLLDSFTRFFQLSLNSGNELSTYMREIEQIRCYVDIQNIRFKKSIDFSVHLDPEAAGLPTLKLIFQPLIENSINHGIYQKPDPRGRIEVRVRRRNDLVVSEISDDGIGIPPEKLKRILHHESEGYGIRNIQQRIQLYFGEGYGLDFKSEPGCGTIAIVRLPVDATSQIRLLKK